MVGQTTGPDTTSMTTKRLPANNLPIDPHATSIVTRKVDPGSVGNGPDIGATKVSSRTRATTYGDGPPTSALVVSKRGVAGGTGTGTDPTVPIGAKRTFAATAAPPPPGSLAQAARPTYIPDPNSYYTAAAKAAKVAGTIVVRIRILASGAVQPIGIEGAGLGYGLNEAAMAVARGTRCKPALDASGHPIDSENVINVRFQNAGVN
jgi:TonB family protein